MAAWTLDEPARDALLRHARAAIAAAIGADVESRAAPGGGPSHASGVGAKGPRDSERAGDAEPLPPTTRAGVTIRVEGDLRGCIGYPEPDQPLFQVVERCAVSAAVSDPRFPAVDAAEWPRIELEISVLGPIEPVRDICEVEVGRHGLVAEFGRRRGLLLPQVAVEWKWDREAFASHTCVKAGLPKDAWKTGARLYKFEADVFGER